MKTQFLRELIEKNARVILPDFGAFLVKDNGSGIFKAENVTFSPFLRYNDGMVEDALASREKISADNAKKALSQYIEELKDVLQSNKVFVIEGLGSLYLDKRGSIQFSTNEDISTIVSSDKNVRPSVKKEQVTKDKNAKTKEEPTPPAEIKDEPLELDIEEEQKKSSYQPKQENVSKAKETSTEIETKSTTPQKDIVSKEVKKESPKTQETQLKPTHRPEKPTNSNGTVKAIMYGTLIGVAFVAILATAWYLYSSGAFSTKDKTIIIPEQRAEGNAEIGSPLENEEAKFEDEFEKLSAEMDVNINADNDEKETISVNKKPVPQQRAVPTQTSSATPTNEMFHLVVGSFRNSNYAEKFSDDMISRGYNSEVILQPTGMYAVSLGSFMSRQQAVDSMNVWKQNLPNIWILQQ